ncbi:endonuclease/exonuclease/phosphatase family protein [Streptomyces sp. NPDC050418]|uniref:endonuclease/exonuclease/phosphatase family protein n=1 Tax=Streptomyces sp. NPDC050418 TaxID=3365612 RepID=UPI00378CA3CF
MWRRARGRVLAVAALLWALLILTLPHAPGGWGNLGSLAQTLLPWTGLGVLMLLAGAALRRSTLAAVAVLVPAVVWSALFAGALGDKRGAGPVDLTVVSHNVSETNTAPSRTARALAASGADVVALQEMPRSGAGSRAYARELAARFPYSAVKEGVGLWSRYPLRDVAPVEILPWPRALRATVATPKGPVAVYVAHLASVRVLPSVGFATRSRNESAVKLAEAVRSERLARVVVAGDLNGSADDSALDPLTGQLRSAQAAAGAGFGLSWPAAFPAVRIDHVLVRGVTPVSAWTLPSTGSDHLPVAASLRW